MKDPEVLRDEFIENLRDSYVNGFADGYNAGVKDAEPKNWIEQNKDRILQAGKEGREVEFRIDGRLFAIREKPQ